MGAKQSFEAHPDGEVMQAVTFPVYGTDMSTALIKESVAKPVPKDNEILIQVKAAALNPIDKIRVEGGLKALSPEAYATPILGYDAAGVVESIGSKVTKFKVGDEVYVRISRTDGQGTLAEYVPANENMAALKPSNISFEEAASLPLVAVTSMQAFKRGGAKEGDKIVITGGAGGVGSIAIQIAKNIYKSSHILTTASPGGKTDFVKSLGADAVADYRSQDFSDGSFGDDFDFGFDTTHDSTKMPLILKENTKIVTISDTPTVEEVEEKLLGGASAGLMIRFFLYMGRNSAAEKNAATRGNEWSYMFLSPNGEDLDTLRGYVESGAVKPVLDSIHKFADYTSAVERAFSGRAQGKVVVSMTE